MSRAERIRKLSNAIKRYRGVHTVGKDGGVGQWVCTPQPAALEDIKTWLARLNLPVAETVALIDGFKSYPEYNRWLQSLS